MMYRQRRPKRTIVIDAVCCVFYRKMYNFMKGAARRILGNIFNELSCLHFRVCRTCSHDHFFVMSPGAEE